LNDSFAKLRGVSFQGEVKNNKMEETMVYGMKMCTKRLSITLTLRTSRMRVLERFEMVHEGFQMKRITEISTVPLPNERKALTEQGICR